MTPGHSFASSPDQKAGLNSVSAPVYSHLSYDRVPGESLNIEQPDILIVEGLNVLAPPATSSALAVSDPLRLRDFRGCEDPTTLPAGTRSVSCSSNRELSKTPRVTSIAYAMLEEEEARGGGPKNLGHHQRAKPRGTTSCPPGRGRRSSCKKKQTHRIRKILLRRI